MAALKFDKRQMDKLSRQKQDVQVKLGSMKAAGKGAWDEFKHGLDAAVTELKSGVENAIAEPKK